LQQFQVVDGGTQEIKLGEESKVTIYDLDLATPCWNSPTLAYYLIMARSMIG
jgi:hypothetical protein